MFKGMIKERFIKKAKRVHGNQYDYSRTKYVGHKTPVKIICKEHGFFKQVPFTHLSGCGCPKCGIKSIAIKCRSNISLFIKKVRKIYGNRYNYSQANYVNNRTPVIIICPKHGVFKQKPYNHLGGRGCPKCGIKTSATKRSLDTSSFVKKAKTIHGNKYDYSQINYIDSRTPVTIICKKHGRFEQVPSRHLSGKGCLKCGFVRQGRDTSSFVKKAKTIHGNKYDYSQVNYINNRTPVTIICKKHGRFEQVPHHHLGGCGCYKCQVVVLRDGSVCDSLTEAYCYLELKKKGVQFKHRETYPASFTGENLGRCKYDFYIPLKNEYIEVTSFHDKMTLNPKIWENYRRKINIKKNYVEKNLGANFRFVQIKLSRKQTVFVRQNIASEQRTRRLFQKHT